MPSPSLNSASVVNVLKERLEKVLQNQDSLPDDTVVESVRDCLERLDEIDVDHVLLAETKIGLTVHEFKNHAVLGDAASALLKKWKQMYRQWKHQQQQKERQEPREEDKQQEEEPTEEEPLQCTGYAAQALQKFRERLCQLETVGQKKPDMVAYKELRNQWTPRCRRHGELEGVPIGLKLDGRGEAAILGIHTKILSGIDAIKDEACFAVCLSGGYADDNDHLADGSVIYTGSGGRKGKHQVKDQEENVDNLSLIASVATKEPIRLLRAAKSPKGKPGYFYEGLYQCTNYTYERSVEGPKVYKFKLVPVPGKSRHSTRVRHTSSGSSNSRTGSRGRLESHMSQKSKTVSRGSRVGDLG